MLTASMPMYDLPETRGVMRELWRGLRRHLQRQGIPDLPAELTRGPVARLWADLRLPVSQCCGMDIVKRYARTLRPLVTPHHGAPGCDGSDYASVVVVAEEVRATCWTWRARGVSSTGRSHTRA